MGRDSGIPLALGAALLFGASTPLAKLALSSANPLIVAGLLYLGSGIGLFVARSIRSGQTETPLSRAELPWLAGAILAGGVVGGVGLAAFGGGVAPRHPDRGRSLFGSDDPQVQSIGADIHDHASVARAVEGASGVVNAVSL